MLRDIFVLERSELDHLMQRGYGDYVYRCTVVAPLMMVAGFLGGVLVPESAQRLVDYFTLAAGAANLDGITLDSISSLSTLFALFFNNFSSSFSAIIWGLLPFIYLSAFTLGINFYLLGTFAYVSLNSDLGLGTYLLSVAPHAIFELPALIIFCAAGLFLCRCSTEKLLKRANHSVTQMFILCVKLLWTAVAPLLLLAAVVECFVTPLLLKLVI